MQKNCRRSGQHRYHPRKYWYRYLFDTKGCVRIEGNLVVDRNDRGDKIHILIAIISNIVISNIGTCTSVSFDSHVTERNLHSVAKVYLLDNTGEIVSKDKTTGDGCALDTNAAVQHAKLELRIGVLDQEVVTATPPTSIRPTAEAIIFFIFLSPETVVTLLTRVINFPCLVCRLTFSCRFLHKKQTGKDV